MLVNKGQFIAVIDADIFQIAKPDDMFGRISGIQIFLMNLCDLCQPELLNCSDKEMERTNKDRKERPAGDACSVTRPPLALPLISNQFLEQVLCLLIEKAKQLILRN